MADRKLSAKRSGTNSEPAPSATNDTPPSWPADQVKRRSIESLIPYANNPNMHSPEQVEQIAASIKAFGWTIPILCDEDGLIIAGHGRVMAAALLGLTSLPVMTAKGWTPAQKQMYVIADNQIPRNSEFDLGVLRVELGEIELLGELDLSLSGFSDVQLNQIMEPPAGDDLTPHTDQDPYNGAFVRFSFGDYRGNIAIDVYKRFVAKVTEQQKSGPISLDALIAGWL